jgi:hypothetical protein
MSREAQIETHQVSHCEDLSFFCIMETNVTLVVTLVVETYLLNPYVSVVEKWICSLSLHAQMLGLLKPSSQNH